MKLFLTLIIALSAAAGWSQDRLRFIDGSSLQGRFEAFDSRAGVRWSSPNAAESLEFTPGGLHRIHLSQRYDGIPESTFSARLRFFNGDVLHGDVISMDGRSVLFKSWFAGRLTGPRSALKSVWFFNHGTRTIYAGPVAGTDDWVVNPPNAWTSTNGFLRGGANAFMGRRFQLPAKARIEFQTWWRGAFNMMVSFYSSNHDRHNYISRGYQMTLAMGFANLNRGGGGPGMSTLGTTATPVHNGLRPVQYEIRVDREKAVIALLMDGKLVHRWTDAAGFAGEENGISFLNRSQSVGLGKIRVSEWDGGFEDADSGALTNVTSPTLKLVNNDTFAAAVSGIKNGRLSFDADGLEMDIPIERIQRLIFPNPVLPSDDSPAAGVQANLITDERLTLQELSYRRTVGPPPAGQPPAPLATGRAVLFGPTKLNPNWITELSFNPDQQPQPFVTPGVGPQGWFLLQ
jgi:hypothetical protein